MNLAEMLNNFLRVTLLVGNIQHLNPGRLFPESKFVILANSLPGWRTFNISPSSTGWILLFLAEQKSSSSFYGFCIDFQTLIFQFLKAALLLKYLSFCQHTITSLCVWFFSAWRLSTPTHASIWLGEALSSWGECSTNHRFFEDLLDSSSLRFSFLSATGYVEMLVPQRQILRTTTLHCYMHRWKY